MLAAAELARHRITIQRRVLTKDSNGEDIEDWEDVFIDVPAAVKPLSVRQFIAASAAQSAILGRFIVRYAPGLESTNRVVEDGIIYDISGWLPDPESGREYYTAPYTMGVNNGGF
jgi:SPP1 family predicted phage head-tail adaptor